MGAVRRQVEATHIQKLEVERAAGLLWKRCKTVLMAGGKQQQGNNGRTKGAIRCCRRRRGAGPGALFCQRQYLKSEQ
jgi:hypothetical protein